MMTFEFDERNDYQLRQVYKAIVGMVFGKLKKRGEVKNRMAFDTTALVTAIAEGKVNEEEARGLLTEAQELEVKIAKLLTPQEAPVQDAPVEEAPTPEVATPTEEASQADAPTPEPVAEEAKPEAHAHMFVEGNTNCTVCGIDISALQTAAPTGEAIQ